MKRMRFVNLLIMAALLLGALPVQLVAPQPVAAQTGAPPRQTSGPDDPAERLMKATGGAAQITINPATGKASFVRLEAGSLAAMKLSRNTDEAARVQALAFFETYGDLFGMSAPAHELQLVGVSADNYGARHVDYAQLYAGVPVFGAHVRVHFNKAGDLTAANGIFIPKLSLDTTPTLSAGAAAAQALAAVIRQQDAESDPAQTGLTARNTTLYVYRTNLVRGIPGDNVLVYEVEVTNSADVREFVYVDAHTGGIVEQFTGVYDSLTRRAFDNEANYPDTPGWVEGDALPSPTTEEGHVIYGAAETYNLFASVSGGAFLSYDGADIGMDSVYNATMSGMCPNAQWTGIYSRFCAGVSGDDTVGHEWSHAYTEGTHNLIYAWQSGALNESYSDIWGEVMDLLNQRGADAPGGVRTNGGCSQYSTPAGADNSYRWLAGEDDPAFGGAIRDMWNPPCIAGDPGKTSDAGYVCSAGDQGGVHTNSGVPNHAFALLVDGGAYNGQTITGVGLTKTLAIYWRAQSVYQTNVSNFFDHADALEASCSDLVGQPIYAPSTAVTLTAAVPPSERITAADCVEVADAAAAVELRTLPDCDFRPMLQSPAPALCDYMEITRPVFTEDWESGALNGWTAGQRDVLNPGNYVMLNWYVAGDLPRERAGQAAFGQANGLGECGTGNDQSSVRYLESPDIVLPAAGPIPQLAFDHTPATEADYDGGNLKISVNGGPWELVPSAAFTFNPYPGELAIGDSTNPLAGEPAFHGNDEGDNSTRWGQSQVDLTGMAGPGDTVRLRFELGIDGCYGTIGWYVDAVRMYQCLPAPLGTLGGAVTDDVTGLPIANATVQAASAERAFTATSAINGAYSMTVVADAYTTTASAYGYVKGVVNGVIVNDGAHTAQDFALTPLPAATLSGKVTDADAGWPLYASLDVAGPAGKATFWSNPETGDYAFNLPTGMTHTLTVKAWAAGYQTATSEVYLAADTVRDFALAADPLRCTAPGRAGNPTDLLQDGGFELGTPNPNWQEYSTQGRSLISSQLAHTGVYGAWQGGAPDATTALSQTATVPADATGLGFWLRVESEGQLDSDDWMTVSLDGNAVFAVNGSEQADYAGWTQIMLDVSAYGDGGAHTLHFDSYNDARSYTSFFIDDVALFSMPPCALSAGGLVVGNVYDANTNLALNGAGVRNQGAYTATTAATPDPDVDEGFYTLFSPAGARVLTAAMTLYSDVSQTLTVVASDTVRQDFHLGASIMEVGPTALDATLNAVMGSGEIAVKSVHITNTGSANLDWLICRPDAYDNGPLVNSPATGAGGADESRVQLGLGMGVSGYGHSVANGARVADDFTLDTCSAIEEITFFAFQTNSSLNSTMTGLNFQIWDGPPNDPASRVLFGDATTNRLLRTQFAGIYRVNTPGDTQRPIMANVAAAGITLPGGVYWLDWQTDGSLISGPWAPPITIDGETTTGNALKFTNGAWTPAMDVGQQGFPFLFNAGIGTGFTWAAPAPLSGTIAPAANEAVAMTFDATGLRPGRYTGAMFIGNNSPTTRLASVTLTLDVIGAALHGLVTDTDTGAPIAGAVVTTAPGGFSALTSADGHYTFTDSVPSGAFTVTVRAFGYFDDMAYPVVVPPAGDITHNVALTPKPLRSLSGAVMDGSGHGWPLYASLEIVGDMFDETIFTAPDSGVYGVTLPQDTPFTFTVRAVDGGYLAETRVITPTAGSAEEDFVLAIDAACTAPGYEMQGLPAEGFESTAFPPSGWTSFRGENGVGMSQDWQRSTTAPYTGTAKAYVQYENVANGLAQDWLVTPRFTPRNGSALTFTMRQSFAPDLDTTYTIRVSTGSQTTHADFAIVKTYREPDLGTSYQPYNVSLSAYAGQAIYVAFVMEQDNGDNWHLDDVTVTPGACNAVSGGMLVGNVAVGNTGAGVNGATVASQDYVSITTVSRAAADDPALDDGFYSLFVPFTGAHPFTAAALNYTTDVQTPTIAAEAITVQDFVLGAIDHTLTLHLAGSGVITPDVGAHSYLSGTLVDLSAAPADGWQFDGWSGDLTGADNPAALMMDAHKEVTATFSALTYTLAVDIAGNGAVTRDPDRTEYRYGDGVTLTATPAPGWYFGQWSGDVSGILTQTTITMDADKSVTATFVSTPPTYYTLTLHMDGSGVITPSVSAHTYLSGTLVALSAAPADGWQFDGWSGDLTGADNPATLTMDAHKEVTAAFTITTENQKVFLPLVLRN